jgi:predicted Rossmann fold nucleotide-binding protein DprA/Smf involved in DNA uptake
VKQNIRERLDELEAERDQLMRALEALTGGGPPLRRRGRPPGSGPGAPAARKRPGGGRRAARGQRRQEVLDTLDGKELGPSEIARSIGVNPTQVSGLLRQLAAEGAVARTPAGKWRKADGAAPASAPADVSAETSSPAAPPAPDQV